MKTLIFFFMLACCQGLFAQQVLYTEGVLLGGNENGFVSYGFGEVIMPATAKADSAIAKGVHQSSISVKMISELKDFDVSVSMFPNPAEDVLKIRVENASISGMKCQLFDMKGNMLISKGIEQAETILALDQLSHGFYILKIHSGAKEIKVFKVIKQ